MPNSVASEEQDLTMLDDDSSTTTTSNPSQSQSQTQSQPARSNTSARMDTNPTTQKGLNANGKRTLENGSTESTALKETSGKDTAMKDISSPAEGGGSAAAATENNVPGASWKSQKAQMEMAKAMDMIIDKEFMIGRKYGDVMDRGGASLRGVS